MFKLGVFLAILAVSAAAPNPAPAPAPGALLATAYALPAAYPVASSSQSVVRNYNTLAAAPLAYTAPLAYAYAPAPTYYV
ncbi:neuropeptide-like 3 [Fopius arisanus]|uniref:Neuropeptide-like 3 n=1 Tax=Fopius arisanus TaxID=64838 RepID=A0A9R1T8Y5_9HYME|nr:PREDICTED: neuropeptide-like 3 [Fopius arisanus]